MEYKHLQVLRNPLYLSLLAPILLFSYANYLAGEVNLVIGHVVGLGGLLHRAHAVSHPAHDARVEKIEYPRREWKLTKLEPDSSSF